MNNHAKTLYEVLFDSLPYGMQIRLVEYKARIQLFSAKRPRLTLALLVAFNIVSWPALIYLEYLKQRIAH